jgi:CBS domain containing-hemolysin-like protein
VGFIHAEDIVRIVLDDIDLRLLSMDDIVHLPVVVPPTKKVDEMFDYFQQHDCRAAVVLNEFGGVAGFVTIADVLNFIFGQIAGRVAGEELHSETDQEAYEVPGDMKLSDFEKLTNFGIEDARMTTIGGVAFRHLDRLPREGDTVCVEDIQIQVLEMDAHRVARVRVERVRAATPAESAPDGQEEPGPEAEAAESPPDVPRPKSEELLDTVETENGKSTRSDADQEGSITPVDQREP